MTNSVRIKKEILDSSREETSSEQVLDLRKSNSHNSEKCCAWCGKKQCDFQDKSVHEGYCSSVCFDLFRRESYKKRASCIWCSSSSSVQNNLTLLNGTTVDESRFCSPQCLTQFKLQVFCEETSAHLDQLKDINLPESGTKGNHAVGNDLITPELWLKKTTHKSTRLSSSSSSAAPVVVPADSNHNNNSCDSNHFQHGNNMLSNRSISTGTSGGGEGSHGRLSTVVTTPTTSPFGNSAMTASPGSGGVGAPPPRKRGRIPKSSSSSSCVTVPNHQRSPNGETYSTVVAPQNSFNPNNLISSAMMNFSANMNNNGGRSNSSSEKESRSSRDYHHHHQRRGSGGGGNVNSNTSMSRQIPIVSSTFPRIPQHQSSSMLNSAFPLTSFPFPPTPSQQQHHHHLLQNERLNMEHIFKVTKTDVGVNTIISNENCNLDSKWLISMMDKSPSLKSHINGDRQINENQNKRGSSVGTCSKTNVVTSYSYPPITMVFPIPLPIPFPIPIPIILDPILSDSKKSKTTHTTTNPTTVEALQDPGIDPPNDNNNTIVIPNQDSVHNGRQGKLKRRGQIIEEEND